AVEGTPSHPSVTAQRRTCCAAEACGMDRSAVAVIVPAGVTTPFLVSLTAGAAALDLNVVPTPEADLTSLTLDQRSGAAVGGDSAVVAQVRAGDEVVL